MHFKQGTKLYFHLSHFDSVPLLLTYMYLNLKTFSYPFITAGLSKVPYLFFALPQFLGYVYEVQSNKASSFSILEGQLVRQHKTYLYLNLYWYKILKGMIYSYPKMVILYLLKIEFLFELYFCFFLK